MANEQTDTGREQRLLGIWAPLGGLVAAGLGLWLLDEQGVASGEPLLQILQGFLVLLGVGGVLTSLRYWQEALAPIWSSWRPRPHATGRVVKWLALAGTTVLLAFWFHDIAWTHDHAEHCFKAYHFWHEMLGRGRLKGWSPFLAFGYPAGELTPFGPELWVALFRAVTLGLLSWTQTYALAFAGVVVFSALAVFRFSQRFFGSAAAVLATIVWVLDPGAWYQGGWFWLGWLGVWPVTLAMSFTLLALVHLADLLSADPASPGRGLLLKAAWWMLASLVTHQLSLVVYGITLPCLLAAEWLRHVRVTRAQVVRFAAAVGLGLGLAAFYLVPMLARSGLTQDLGLRGSSLADLAQRLFGMRLFENGWPPIEVLGLMGGVLALRSRSPSGLFFVLCASLFVLLSSDILVGIFHIERLLAGILKIECPRMLLVAKLFTYPLAGHAVVACFRGRACARRHVPSPRRRLGVVVLLAALGAPLVQPAAQHIYRTRVKKQVEHRSEGSLVRDLQKFYEWSKREREATSEPYRIAYSLAERHDHVVSISPVFNHTFLYKVGYTPAQQFRSFPMSDEPDLLEALQVKYLVADHDYGNPVFIPEQTIGKLRVYRFSRYRAFQPFTLLGSGQVELVRLEPELIQLRLRGTSPGTRLKLHVAGFPRWQAKLNGREVAIEPATVYGMEYPILMEVPVADGDLRFAYVRRAPDWLGLLVTLVTLLLVGFVAMGHPLVAGRPAWLHGLRLPPGKSARVLVWGAGATLVVGGLLLLWLVPSAPAPAPEPVLDSAAAAQLALGETPCQAQGASAWRCGEHEVSRDVVTGAYGSHICWTTRAAGPLRVATRRQLGRFLVASYDPGVDMTGRIRIYADDELLGDTSTRGYEDGLVFVQVDTRSRAGRLVTLRLELLGAPLRCFDLRILR